MFEPLKIDSQTVGFIYHGPHATLFFGNRFGTLKLLEKSFPDVRFHQLQQVHSSKWTEAHREPPLADAHFTSHKNVGLIVRTADCLPILICNQNGIAAVHAGWRGIVGGILNEHPHQFSIEGSEIYIGPHINASSFEVGTEVLEQIRPIGHQLSIPENEFILSHRDQKKSYVDLSRIVRAQLIRAGAKSIFTHDSDTLTDLNFFSYRRDHNSQGRQISFVIKKNL
ncbi:MAG: polyphenol oxidase family protein [Bdellovibrionales bacterium]|nr:polyphenol oxidase family protein [Bdellovibrionales bacterium]